MHPPFIHFRANLCSTPTYNSSLQTTTITPPTYFLVLVGHTRLRKIPISSFPCFNPNLMMKKKLFFYFFYFLSILLLSLLLEKSRYSRKNLIIQQKQKFILSKIKIRNKSQNEVKKSFHKKKRQVN